MTNDPRCFEWIHLDRSGDFSTLRCRAFPEEIPVPIQMNQHDHREPYSGDHGIRPTDRRMASGATDDRPQPRRSKGRGRVPR